jgi:hypothetical protein
MILGFTLLGIVVFLPKGLWSLFTRRAVAPVPSSSPTNARTGGVRA